MSGYFAADFVADSVIIATFANSRNHLHPFYLMYVLDVHAGVDVAQPEEHARIVARHHGVDAARQPVGFGVVLVVADEVHAEVVQTEVGYGDSLRRAADLKDQLFVSQVEVELRGGVRDGQVPISVLLEVIQSVAFWLSQTIALPIRTAEVFTHGTTLHVP